MARSAWRGGLWRCSSARMPPRLPAGKAVPHTASSLAPRLCPFLLVFGCVCMCWSPLKLAAWLIAITIGTDLDMLSLGCICRPDCPPRLHVWVALFAESELRRDAVMHDLAEAGVPKPASELRVGGAVPGAPSHIRSSLLTSV